MKQEFAWVGEDHCTINDVCRHLPQASIRTRIGTVHWDHKTTWDMLKNPAYKGEAAFGKTRTNLTPREEEIDHLLTTDSGAKGVRSVPEFGRKMVAVLRAELGDVTRFQRADQVVAYAGLDMEVRQSGKWRGEARLSRARAWAATSALVHHGGTLYPAQATLPLGCTTIAFWPVARPNAAAHCHGPYSSGGRSSATKTAGAALGGAHSISRS